MLKRRGMPSRSGLARAAPLGFSRKKKAVPLLHFFPLSFSFLLLFILSSSSFNFLPLSSLFLFSNFFSKRKILKKTGKLQKKEISEEISPFFSIPRSLISLPSSSLFCAVSFSLSSHRVSHHHSFCCFLFYCLLSGGFCVFFVCACVL